MSDYNPNTITYTYFNNGMGSPFVLASNDRNHYLGRTDTGYGWFTRDDNGKFNFEKPADNPNDEAFLYTDYLHPTKGYKQYTTFVKDAKVTPDKLYDSFLSATLPNLKPEDLTRYGILFNPDTKTYSIDPSKSIHQNLLVDLASKIYTSNTSRDINGDQLIGFLQHPMEYEKAYSNQDIQNVMDKYNAIQEALGTAQKYLSGRLGSGFQLPVQEKPAEEPKVESIEDLNAPWDPGSTYVPFTVGTTKAPQGEIKVNTADWNPKALKEWYKYRNDSIDPEKDAAGPNAGGASDKVSETSDTKSGNNANNSNTSGSILPDSNDMSIFNYLLADKSLQDQRTANLSKKQDMGLIPMLMALYGMGQLM